MSSSHRQNSPISALPRLAPGHLRRPKLIAQLENSTSNHVVVLHAPPGSGKTNLVADWASDAAAMWPTVWVNVERDHASDRDLWASVVRSFAAVLGHDPAAGHDLVAELAARGEPFTLVIDDFHDASWAAQQQVLKFVQSLRLGRVVLLTRTVDPGMLALYRAQLPITLLTAEDLAFSDAEIAALAEIDELQQLINPAEIREATGGMPLLVRLVMQSACGSRAEHSTAAIGNFAVDVLGESRLQAGLVLALVPAVNTELAAQLTGLSDVADLLDSLERDGLGHVDRDGYFVFHGAVRAALARVATQTLTEQHVREVRAEAAAHFRADPAQLGRALNLLVESGQFGELWPIFAATFVDQSPAEAASVLAALVPGPTPLDGTAATIAAVIRGASEPMPSISLLRMVDDALDDLFSRPPATDRAVAVYRELAILALLWSAKRYVDGAARADRLVHLAQLLDSSATNDTHEAAKWGLLHSSVTLALVGDFLGARRVLAAIGVDRVERRAVRVRVQRAFMHAMGGEVALAAELLEEGLSAPSSPPWDAKLTITRAAVLLESGDPSGAHALLRALEPQLSQVQEWPYLLTVLSRTYIATDPVAGVEDLDRLMRLHGNRPISPCLQDILFGALGDLALAAVEVQRAMQLVGSPTPDEPARLLCAARLALFSRDSGIIADLRALTEQATLWPRMRAQALMLLAVHLNRQGAEDHAGRALKQALVITRSHRIRLIQALVPFSELEKIAAKTGLELRPNVAEANPLEPSLSMIALTERETVLLRRLASDATLRDIAAQEFVTLHTVKSQTASIYRKLGVRSRQAAVHEAYLRGIVVR